MSNPYRALAALLQYPSAEMAEAVGEVVGLVGAGVRLPRSARASLDHLADRLGSCDLMAAQEEYVGLFDRSRSLSLHLFEHIHGESRDRGQAMVNLASHYEMNGYHMATNELPDYLPLFLEFLSLVDPDEAAAMLSDVSHILAAIRIRLEKRGSDYAGVFQALESMAGKRADKNIVEQLLRKDKSPEAEAAELDKEWEEAPAFSSAPDGGCAVARESLNRMAELAAENRTYEQHGA